MNRKCKYCGTEKDLHQQNWRGKNYIYNTCNSCRRLHMKISNLNKPKRHTHLKTFGKTYEQIYGEEKGNQLREIRRKARIGYKFSEETIKKISLANTGYKHTIEARKKMSNHHKGFKQSQETILKRANSIRGCKHPPLTKEQKEHISKGTRNGMNNPVTKEKNRLHAIKQLQTGHGTFSFTSIEKKVILFLKEKNIKCIPQYWVSDIKHRFIADIFIPQKKLIIECDGNYWHKYPNNNEIDKIRSLECNAKGYNILRFWGTDIDNNFNFVKGIITTAIGAYNGNRCLSSKNIRNFNIFINTNRYDSFFIIMDDLESINF